MDISQTTSDDDRKGLNVRHESNRDSNNKINTCHITYIIYLRM